MSDITLTLTDYHILLQSSEAFREKVIRKFLLKDSDYVIWMALNCIGQGKIECIKRVKSHFNLGLIQAKELVEKHLSFNEIERVATHTL